MSSSDAQLCEIFTSFQGEGIYCGEKQIFLRFSGCNLNCDYCDTQQSLVISPEYRLEQTPGKHDFKILKNPVSVSELHTIVMGLNKNIHSLCLTGGEPLLQVDYLKNFLPEIKKEGITVFLETNGTLPKYLEEVINEIDIISMDIKLPSSSGGTFQLKEQKEFLETAFLKEVYVKVVVVPGTSVKEIDDAAKLVESVDPSIPLVIQPATPTNKIKHRPAIQELFALHTVAKKRLKTVRVIPQMHKVMGIL